MWRRRKKTKKAAGKEKHILELCSILEQNQLFNYL